MKKITGVILVLVMLLSFVLVPAQAAEAAVTKDAFVFERLVNGNLKLTDYTDKDSTDTINIPSTVDGLQVERIGEYAFSGCQAKSITIPSTVKLIETFAFDNCTQIQKISIPNTVYFMDGNPFTCCTSLVNISLDPKHPTLQVTSDGVLYSKRNKMILCYPCSKQDQTFSVKAGTLTIGKNAFYKCDQLETITLPNTVTEIYEGAFLGCAKLNSIKLPDSLLSIGALAFSGCTHLWEIKIPEKISRIERSTFFGCSGLTGVSLPQDLTDIYDMAFFGCTSLEEIHLPGSLSRIGEKAFANCSSLTDAYIPLSVTKIGDAAFENCSVRLYLHLEEYTYPEIYAKIYDISFTYDNEDSFLTESGDTEAE